jgi:ABC-type polar amino acid transport system ATPase subunit
VVCGPSGSGKSTLLRCISGLDAADEGEVWVAGRRVGEGHQRDIGMVFQHFNLYPHLTAVGNITLAPRFARGVPRSQALEKARYLLQRVGLADKEASYPSQLSGGEQQRVAIARALATEPKVMLFDEPTSALDPETIHDVLQVLRDLAHEAMTMVIVTHEMNFAREIADRVVFMAEGTVVEEGDAETVLTSARDHRTRRFLERVFVH